MEKTEFVVGEPIYVQAWAPTTDSWIRVKKWPSEDMVYGSELWQDWQYMDASYNWESGAVIDLHDFVMAKGETPPLDAGIWHIQVEGDNQSVLIMFYITEGEAE